MIDTELLRDYQEWRAGNEGRMVDVSPEAFALQKATDLFVKAVERGASDDDVIEHAGELVHQWREYHAPTD